MHFAAIVALLLGITAVTFAIEPVPYKTPDRLADVLAPLQPMQVRLEGYLGQRILNNAKNRLLVVDEEELLAGFRNRPGKQEWIGEHVGKFLHAATLAWANTGDAQLKAKIDRVAAGLIQCQGDDGYLGTYLPKDRWTSWDVWVHKYCLIGLLTHYQYTGDERSLAACRKMADLLVATFPAKKSIIAAGTHVGMAATSVMEPIVMLYRFTGDQRYIDFAKYIITAYDEPGGPRVISSLLAHKSVRRTANGKAYEMMSNLVGLCELARATGDRSLIAPAINAWEDIVAHQLYVTGAASHGEHFHEDNNLPNHPKANVGETCVTTTWIQLNAQLLRLTGDARYGQELERAYYNHLAGAQLPDGSKWCYYTALMGTKPYGPGTNCCVSSGPRAMALAPIVACMKYSEAGAEGIAVEFLESARVEARLGGQNVSIIVDSKFPRTGAATITLKMAQPATFGVKLRCPEWATPMVWQIGGERREQPGAGWVSIPPRQWKDGDRIELSYTIAPRLIAGQHSNMGSNALAWGPFVLAYDAGSNAGLPIPAALALVEGVDGAPLGVEPVAGEKLAFRAAVRATAEAKPVKAIFVPFAEAGAHGSRYQVWMSTTNRTGLLSLLASGNESQSHRGNVSGSIIDGERDNFVVTFDGTKRDEDSYTVTMDAPIQVRRIVYAHGKTFHDGGWFDASAGKPGVQVQRTKGGVWETIGTLDEYPATTAANAGGLKDGQEFTLKLAEPLAIIAVRIVGKPASGDNPKQAFSSCGELSAWAD